MAVNLINRSKIPALIDLTDEAHHTLYANQVEHSGFRDLCDTHRLGARNTFAVKQQVSENMNKNEAETILSCFLFQGRFYFVEEEQLYRLFLGTSRNLLFVPHNIKRRHEGTPKVNPECLDRPYWWAAVQIINLS